jgi:hypothetical protein
MQLVQRRQLILRELVASYGRLVHQIWQQTVEVLEREGYHRPLQSRIHGSIRLILVCGVGKFQRPNMLLSLLKPIIIGIFRTLSA